MGVLGLQSFMERTESLFERVCLADIADQYRNETKEDPVMLVDISSCLLFLAPQNEFIMLVSGGLKQFMNNLKLFINNCLDLGIKLKIYAEGLKPDLKEDLWVEKTKSKILDLKRLYNNETCPRIRNLASGSFLNWLLEAALPYFVSTGRCEFKRSLYEADDSIIKYARTIQCFAVLSSDTDFIIAEGARYCLTLKNIDLHSMTMFNYNRNNLMKYLNISSSQLLVLGSLCSRSVFDINEMKNFEDKNNLTGKNKFCQVAELVRNLSLEEILKNPYNLKTDLCLNHHEVILVKKKLNFLLGNGDSKGIKLTTHEKWNKIICLAERRHSMGLAPKDVLLIIAKKILRISVGKMNVLKPGPAVGLKPLRKKIYGIIFLEYPETEVVVTEIQGVYKNRGHNVSIDTWNVSFKRRFHPGLLELWDADSSDRSARMKVFAQALNENLRPDDLQPEGVPEALLFPLFIAFYLLWESEIKIDLVDAYVFLFHSVMVNYFSAEVLDKCPLEFHLGALELEDWINKTQEYLVILNAVCGNPFDGSQLSVENYFDGRILHYVYGRMHDKTGSPPRWPPEVCTIFDNLKAALDQLSRRCDYSVNKPV